MVEIMAKKAPLKDGGVKQSRQSDEE